MAPEASWAEWGLLFMTRKKDSGEDAEETRIRHRVLGRRTRRTLSPREHLILAMLSGRDGAKHTPEEVGRAFNLSSERIQEIESNALRKLAGFNRATGIPMEVAAEAARNASAIADDSTEHQFQIALQETIESVRELTPDLIRHLRHNHDHIDRIPPDILEHLVAEVFASWGWDEVRLVGRSSETSADILAGYRIPSIGSRVRFFVEVKRWRSRVGIEIVEQVLGAMFAERVRFGWHAALIVATGGYKSFRNYTADDLKLKGVELKDKEDLIQWLSDYKPSNSGLWLPTKLL
jgi:hypothetical protein